MVQLTPASWGSYVHFRADRTTCNSLTVSVKGRVFMTTVFSDVVAVCCAVLYFVELHSDVPMSPGDCGARSRVHEVLRYSSWVRRAPSFCK